MVSQYRQSSYFFSIVVLYFQLSSYSLKLKLSSLITFVVFFYVLVSEDNYFRPQFCIFYTLGWPNFKIGAPRSKVSKRRTLLISGHQPVSPMVSANQRFHCTLSVLAEIWYTYSLGEYLGVFLSSFFHFLCALEQCPRSKSLSK